LVVIRKDIMLKLLKDNKQKKDNPKGQITMEFMFCMVVILIMFWSSIRVLRWTGLDLAERRIGHDKILMQPTYLSFGCLMHDYLTGNWSLDVDYRDGPIKQLAPAFHQPTSLNAWWAY